MLGVVDNIQLISLAKVPEFPKFNSVFFFAIMIPSLFHKLNSFRFFFNFNS